MRDSQMRLPALGQIERMDQLRAALPEGKFRIGALRAPIRL